MAEAFKEHSLGLFNVKVDAFLARFGAEGLNRLPTPDDKRIFVKFEGVRYSFKPYYFMEEEIKTAYRGQNR